MKCSRCLTPIKDKEFYALVPSPGDVYLTCCGNCVEWLIGRSKLERQLGDEDWKKAKDHLDWTFSTMHNRQSEVGIMSILHSLESRYEKGERTIDLYESMISADLNK